MTDEQSIARGHRAEAEIALTNEAFNTVRADLVERLIRAADPVTVMQIHGALQTVDMVRQALRVVVIEGQHAAAAVAMSGLG